ncbi:MAG: 2-hydroxyacid dehydrogenase [Propionibacteriaceae bacterium]|jgi:D-3-phosphoglycerate dehydrogenase|nr:2-hydroxyacid dehydrogenase [Propionibacteriaceae bacterium]
MKVLALADLIIDAETLAAGLATAPELTADLTIREWRHESVEAMQADNLLVEQHGPEAIPTPPGIFAGLEDFDVLITGFCPVPAAVIAQGPRLKAIGVLRAGVENVDVAAAEAQGVAVVNAPGRNANAVAEFSVGMILAETRDIARSHEQVRGGQWRPGFPNTGAIREMNGRAVGVVGLGQIGQIVARLLTAFGAKVSYYDPFVAEAPYPRVESLVDLAAQVDILTIHSRLTEATKRMVSADVIAALRPHAVLVNTARSGLVDEPALVEALREHRIMGAAIDTFDDEPLPPDSPFLTLDNVTITSHLAGTTVDSFAKTPVILAERLVRALA